MANMQPSEYEIQREVEALRDIRRRSTTPGALTLDPDLPGGPGPHPSSPTSPRSEGMLSPIAESGVIRKKSSASAKGLANDDEEPGTSSNNPSGTQTAGRDDPFHLFWVPASLHPEIAPAEFRAFLKEHARGEGASPDSLSRSTSRSSLSSGSAGQGLGRKQSMLSRQYKPSVNDGVPLDPSEEVVKPLDRRSSRYANQGPQLTINDLQKLEELAEEAARGGGEGEEPEEGKRLRNILRRSLSLNLSPGGTYSACKTLPFTQ